MTASERWTFAGEGQAERVKAETPADGDFSYQTGLLGRGGLAGTNGFKEQYVRDPAGTPVALRHADGERGYYLFDSLGSIAAVTQEDGTVGVRYRYDPYGNERDTTGSLSNRLRFAGQYFDSLGHYHMGTRLYLPAIGRWTQQDPLDQTGDLYEGNRYVYAGGDPVNLTDPTGTHIVEDAYEGAKETSQATFNGSTTMSIRRCLERPGAALFVTVRSVGRSVGSPGHAEPRSVAPS